MKKLIYTAVLFIAFQSFSQTKLISHKSHSGNNNLFKISVENNLFDISGSNFGEAPMRIIKNAQLDTLVFIDNDKVVMITSEYCKDQFGSKIVTISNGKDERPSNELGVFWKSGKDTLVNHPLFSRKNSLDSIKKVLTEEYFFKNNIEDVVIIGHESNYHNTIKSKKEKKKTTPFLGTLTMDTKTLTLFSLLLISSVLSFILWKQQQTKLRTEKS